MSVLGPAATQDQFGFTRAGARFRAVEIAAGPDPLRDGRAVLRLRTALREADVVHAHGMRAGLLAALACPRAAPLIVTWHNVLMGGGLKARVLGRLEQRVARSATVALCASDDLVDRVLRLGGRDVRSAPVAAPGLPPASRDRAQVRTELGAGPGALLLSVGRLHRQKGYDLLIDAAARWRERRPQPLVVIAGTGPEHDALASRIAESGAPVRLLGHRDDIGDLLAACDLAVVSSRWEARQLFAQEALRAGAPLVSTAVGGLPGLLGDAAVLVPVEPDGTGTTVDALDEAVRGLLADRASRLDYASRGPMRAAGWPTEADTVAQLVAVYAELVGTQE